MNLDIPHQARPPILLGIEAFAPHVSDSIACEMHFGNVTAKFPPGDYYALLDPPIRNLGPPIHIMVPLRTSLL